MNIESKKLLGEDLFRNLYTSIISLWIFWWWIENDLFLLSKTWNDDSYSSYTLGLNTLSRSLLILMLHGWQHLGYRTIFELSLHCLNPPPLFIKGGGWSFPKMAVIGARELENFYCKWGDARNGWVGFTSYIAYPYPFFQMLSTPPSSLSPRTPPPLCSFCCLASLTEWVITPRMLLYLMIIWIYMLNVGTIVPEGPWYVFYARGLTHNVVFYW